MWYLGSEDEPSAKAESEVEPKEGRGRKRAGKKKTGAQKKRERAAREEGPDIGYEGCKDQSGQMMMWPKQWCGHVKAVVYRCL